MPDQPSILSLFKLTDDQQAAATAMDGAISVQAGAGSGKTRALVGRFLALLESGLPLRSLVAITFTDKAAREMRNRIRGVTSEWLAHKDAVADQERWNEVFSALDSARISTIHGLCATILRAHPAEAGVDPVFSLLEEGQSAVWQVRAVEAALVSAVNDDELAHLFHVYQEGQVRRMLGDLLARRLDVTPLLGEVVDAETMLARWSDALAEWFTRQVATAPFLAQINVLMSAQSSAADDKLEVARRTVLGHWESARQAHADRDWDTCFASLTAMRKATAARGGQKGNWDGDDLAAVRDAMKAVREQYEASAGKLVPSSKELRWSLDEQAVELLTLVRKLFLEAQTIYRGYKDDANALDFDDLEQMTAHLLRDHDAIRQRWQEEISAVLLVDEFQDTNERQREIVYALVGFQGADGRAHIATNGSTPTANGTNPNAVPRVSPTSLFVVGDAKQSIYRFRGADVAVFRQVQRDISQAGGALIDFNLTFRAHKDLLDLTNELLAPIMSTEEQPDRPYDVPFAPLTAFRQTPRDGIAPPYFACELGLGENKAEGRSSAATALAQCLKTMQANGEIEWQDVALLFRSSTAYGAYEDALEQAAIPYVTVAGRGFYQRPEIRDLLNALAAIADPTDDLAMAGYLRSPAIGCSDAMIHRLRWGDDGKRRPFWGALRARFVVDEADGDGAADDTLADENSADSVADDMSADISADDLAAAEFALTLLESLHRQAGRVSVAHLLKSFLDQTHYRSILRLAPGGERLRRNVDKLLDAAYRSQLVSVSEFLEYVAVLRDVGARESEAPTEAGGAVQLMTIHKSKGLEFPIVVLADAGYTRTARGAPFYLDHRLGLVLNPPNEDAVAITHRLAAWQEGEQEAAEERRLLYVAATRAMEKLIVSGDVRRSTAKSSPGKLLMAGWLHDLAEVVGLAGTTLNDVPGAARDIALKWGDGSATCQIWPATTDDPMMRHNGSHEPTSSANAATTALLAPVPTPSASSVARRLPARSPDPAVRIWQVVASDADPTTVSVTPDWLVSHLFHVALRYWQLPNVDDDTSSHSMHSFLRSFALEAGVTEPSPVVAATTRATELLAWLRQSEFYSEISNANRHHHVPYSFVESGETVSGVIDLLYQQPAGPWAVAECITTALPMDVNLQQYVNRTGYKRLLTRVGELVAQQVKAQPMVKLVFLDVGGAVVVYNDRQPS